MSESQKRMAKRIVEILIETGFVKVDDYHGDVLEFHILAMKKEDFIKEITMAIATYQAEEIEKEMKAVITKKCPKCREGIMTLIHVPFASKGRFKCSSCSYERRPTDEDFERKGNE